MAVSQTICADPPTTCGDLLRRCLGHVVCKFLGASRSYAHCRRILPYVDLVEKAVDSSVFLIKTDGQGHGVPGVISELLEFEAEMARLLGS